MWCGRCGARLDDDGPPDEPADERAVEAAAEDHVDEVDDGPVRRRRSLLAGGALVALALTALAIGRGTPPPESLLGVAGAPVTSIATGPPATGLQLAWEHDFDQPSRGFGGAVDGQAPVELGDGLVAVGATVVDTATGDVVASWDALGGTAVAQGWATVVDDELLLADAATGEVLRRTELGSGGTAGYVAGDVDGVVLLTTYDRRTDTIELLRVEGDEVTPLDGIAEGTGFGFGRVGADGLAVQTLDGVQPRWVVNDLLRDTTAELPGPPVGRVLRVDDGYAVAPGGRDGLYLVRADGSQAGNPTVFGGPVSVVGRLADDRVVLRVLDGPSTRRHRVLAVDLRTTRARELTRAVAPGGLDDPFFHDDVNAAVAGDRVVVLDDERDRVQAIDGGGEVAWQLPLDGADAVAASDDHVLVSDRTGARPARLVAVAAGRVVWTGTTVNPGYQDSVTAVAAVADGVVLSPAAFGPFSIVLDPVTGEPADPARPTVSSASRVGWVMPGVDGPVPVMLADAADGGTTIAVGDDQPMTLPSDAAGPRTNAFPAARFGDHVLVDQVTFSGTAGPQESELWLVEVTTGARTRLDVAPQAIVQPAVWDGHRVTALAALLVRDEGRLTSLAGDAEPLWRVEDPGGQLVDRVGDVLVLRDTTSLIGLDATTGEVRWRAELARHVARTVVAGGAVVSLGVDGTLRAHDLVTGEPTWTTTVAPGATRLVAAGDHVLLGTADGRVFHLDASGQLVQEIAAGQGPVRSLALVDGTLVVGVDGVARGFRDDAIPARDVVDVLP